MTTMQLLENKQWYRENRSQKMSLILYELEKKITKTYNMVSRSIVFDWMKDSLSRASDLVVQMLNQQNRFDKIREFDLVTISYKRDGVFAFYQMIPVVRLEDMKDVRIIGSYSLKHNEIYNGMVLKKWDETKRDSLGKYISDSYLAVLVSDQIVLLRDKDYFDSIFVAKKERIVL